MSYKKDGVIILPGQDKMVFSVINTTDDILDSLSRCVNNLLTKAHTTQLIAYGIIADFADDDRLINLEFQMQNSGLMIRFNEHHTDGDIVFNTEFFREYIKNCTSILGNLGYEMESEEQ